MLAQQRTLAIPCAVDFILQACDAIAEAHSLGIVHRDLKPQNLFVTRRNDNTSLVKVLDFGISKSAAGGDFAATRTQAVMGSPAYMSPEQMRSAKLVDARTDVWALGVILYQLVLGRVPWEAETFTELCFKVAMDPLPPFQNMGILPGFERAVRRCLEKDPNHRFADVYELAVALLPFAPPHAQPLVERIGRVLHGQAGERAAMPTIVAIGPGTLPDAAGQRVTRTANGSRRRSIAGLVAACGLLAGIIVAVAVLGRGGDSESADRPPPPAAERAAAQPAHISAPVAAQPSPSPVVAQPALAATPPPPAAVQPPARVISPSSREVAPATKVEQPAAPAPPAQPHDRKRRRPPGPPVSPSTIPSEPAQTARTAPPPARPMPDPLSSPD